jgi:D-alanyl-D-alanine dipeptidase
MIQGQDSHTLLSERFNDLIHNRGLAARRSTGDTNDEHEGLRAPSQAIAGVRARVKGEGAIMVIRGVFCGLVCLLAVPAQGYSTEGCQGRKDPYQGKPPKPPGLISKGSLRDHLVPLANHLNTHRADLKYATQANVTEQALYPQGARCWVRPELAQALTRAAAQLARGNIGLVVYDCYRPWSVQVKLWAACPKRGLVGDPAKGSHHNRGAAIDLGLYNLKSGQVLAMPSAFDDLSKRARHSYAGGTAEQREHRRWLAVTMRRAGLRSIASEWWHYQLRQARRFPPLDLPLQSAPQAAP